MLNGVQPLRGTSCSLKYSVSQLPVSDMAYDRRERLCLCCLLYTRSSSFSRSNNCQSQNNFDPAPPFSSELCALYFRNCCSGDGSGLES